MRMEQRKEQKKEQRVYAAFGRGARRDWKRAARKTVFSHYWMAIMVCLVAAFLGTEFTGSLESLHFTRQKWDVISNFLASFGRPGAAANSRGVFAIAVNKIADGSLQNIVNNTIMSLAGSIEFWQSFGIVVSSLVSMTYWVLVTHTFVVILRRLFMEMRVYEEVPPYRALYLHSARCWGRTSLALLRVAVQRGLWWLTIIGGAIKTFSYYLCGFILAENPTMKGGDAIALSRKMMNGHKWECFLLELSFVPWHLLSLATFGLSSLFYSSAYLSAARCEFYAAVRAQVKAEGEAQALRDTYLFEKAGAKTLRRAYNDLGRPAEKLPERVYGNRVTRFFGECLGVTLFVNPQGEWNSSRIVFDNGHVEHWLNGHKILEFEAWTDDWFARKHSGKWETAPEYGLARRGVICLQDHGSPASFRNLKIKELPRKAGREVELFNGKDLTGWEAYGTEKWYVDKDGNMVCESGPDKEYGYLATREYYNDFDLTLEFKQLANGNSGVFFRSFVEPPVKVHGWQCEVAPKGFDTAGIYESYGRGWLVQIPDEKEDILREGEWNTLRLKVQGDRVQTWLNGEEMVDITDARIGAAQGRIALQIHDGGGIKVLWRNFRLTTL